MSLALKKDRVKRSGRRKTCRKRGKKNHERTRGSPSFRVLYGPCWLSTYRQPTFATGTRKVYIVKRARERADVLGRLASSINCTPGNKPPPLIGSELADPALRGPIEPNYPTCISRSPASSGAHRCGCTTRKLKRRPRATSDSRQGEFEGSLTAN